MSIDFFKPAWESFSVWPNLPTIAVLQLQADGLTVNLTGVTLGLSIVDHMGRSIARGTTEDTPDLITIDDAVAGKVRVTFPSTVANSVPKGRTADYRLWFQDDEDQEIPLIYGELVSKNHAG